MPATRSPERTEFYSDILLTSLDGQSIGLWGYFGDIVPDDSTPEVVSYTLYVSGDGHCDLCKADNVVTDEIPEGINPDRVQRFTGGKGYLGCTGHRVDHGTVAHAFTLLGKGKAADASTPLSLHTDYIKAAREAERELDAGEIDAELADIIVQVGLFDRVIFG